MNIAANNFIKESSVDDFRNPGGPSECQSLPLTSRAFYLIHALDGALVGTPDYTGLAFFWHYDYRNYLREATPRERKAVHDAFLGESLPLDGVSIRHDQIVKKITAKRFKKIYG